MPKAQPPLKRGADVFRRGDLPRRIAGDLRRRRRYRQESRGVAGAWIEGGARDLPVIIDALGGGQIQRRALQLLTRYLRLFDDEQSLATPELRRLMVDHVYDLVALALGATRDAAAIANGRGLRAARLHAIKTEILNRLASHKLSLAGLAARQGVTPRHVQMLFENDGTTFSRFLLDQRLARAHRMLGSNPLLAERTISTIAYEAGFGDLSHFNRAFRRRYGQTPSDVRARQRQGGEGVDEPRIEARPLANAADRIAANRG